MDKQVLKQVLLDSAQLVEKIEIMPRAYVLDESVNYVFTCVRRAGKSFMMYAIIKQLLHSGCTYREFHSCGL